MSHHIDTVTDTVINCRCPLCQQNLDYYKQQLDPRSKLTPRWIGTCRNLDCDYAEVTLSDANWTRIQVDSEFAAGYRGMNKRIMGIVNEHK